MISNHFSPMLVESAAARNNSRMQRVVLTLGFLVAVPLLLCTPAFSQQSSEPNETEAPAAQQPDEGTAAGPTDWGPDLLYGILSSPNEDALGELLRATFAAGPSVVPQLAEALKDDRTAEYAAQALAYIGGEKSLDLLWKLLSDPRNLNLRRFTYGALAEYEAPEATNLLLDVISRSDSEPDRTVTETAVIALTVLSDPKVLARLREVEHKLQDVVIRDDVDSACFVIEGRDKYLASPEGKKAGGSVAAAVRTYFIAGLQSGAPPVSAPHVATNQPGASANFPKPIAPPKPPVTVDIQDVTLTPGKDRALARVVFEDPTARANYDIVLEKRGGNWSIASVWLGAEVEKAAPTAVPAPVESKPK